MFNFKVTAEARRRGLGWWFIFLSVFAALFVLSSAKGSASPILFIAIFGSLFVGFPVGLGVGLLTGRIRW